MENDNGIENETEMTDSGDEGVDLEQETEQVEAAATVKEPKVKAYEQFLAGLRLKAASFGNIEEKSLKNFVSFRNPKTKHGIWIARQARAVTVITTTLPVAGEPGTIPLEEGKHIGRVTCRLERDAVEYYLEMLATSEAPLPPPARKAKAAASPSAE